MVAQHCKGPEYILELICKTIYILLKRRQEYAIELNTSLFSTLVSIVNGTTGKLTV